MAFTHLTFPHRPGYLEGWHHREITRALQLVEAGEIRRLLIFMPPQHGKSELTSIRFPAWWMGRRRGNRTRVIATSYGLALAQEFGRKVRDLVAEPLYQQVFPGVRLHPDATAASRWNTADGGAYIAAGVRGPIAGKGADLLLIDDPFKDYEEASSPVVRQAVWDWYQSTAYPRLAPDGAIVGVLTRWHDDDWAGRVLQEMERGGEKWDVVSLPALAERDEPNRREGEALWEARFPKDRLLGIREVIGTRNWLALYQQRPPKETGAIFKGPWWKFYRERPPHPLLVLLSADTAFKDKQENDYSVLQTWGLCAGGFYLFDSWRDRVEFPELKRQVKALHARDLPHAVVIEDAASGQSLIQELQRETRIPVLPFKVDKDIVLRAHAASPMVEAGTVFLPEEAPWLADFLTEHAGFPNAPHDDQVAATVQALLWFRENGFGNMEIATGGRRETAGFVDRFAGAGVTEQRGMARTPEEAIRREPDRKRRGPYGGY